MLSTMWRILRKSSEISALRGESCWDSPFRSHGKLGHLEGVPQPYLHVGDLLTVVIHHLRTGTIPTSSVFAVLESGSWKLEESFHEF